MIGLSNLETSGARSELLFVLVVMGVLVIAGLVAVFIFVRQWRRERLGNAREQHGDQSEIDRPEA